MSWIESLDVNAYVQQILQKEVDQMNKVTQNKVNELTTTQSAWKTKVSSYNQIQSQLNTYNQNIKKLTDAFKPSYNVTSSATDVATATLSGTTTPGTHALQVEQLAQAQRVASKVVTTKDELDMSNTLTVGVGSTSYNVTITETDTIDTIANKINIGADANDLGISASVVSTGDNKYQLVVSSTKTGLANKVDISETGTSDNALNISTGVGGTGTVLTEAKNAKFTLDTLSYELSSNTNVIDGMNITLLKGGNATANISVNEGDTTSQVSTAMQNVIDSYNQIMTTIAKTQQSGTASDPNLSLLQTTLTSQVVNSPTLIALGITPMAYDKVPQFTVTRTDGETITGYPVGLLTLNTDASAGTTFSDKVKNNFSSTQSALTGEEGVFTKVSTSLTTSTGSTWKILNDTITGAIPLSNTKVSDLQEQIDKTKLEFDKNKTSLVKKYAELDLMLSQMQVTSQYMTAQLASFNNK